MGRGRRQDSQASRSPDPRDQQAAQGAGQRARHRAARLQDRDPQRCRAPEVRQVDSSSTRLSSDREIELTTPQEGKTGCSSQEEHPGRKSSS